MGLVIINTHRLHVFIITVKALNGLRKLWLNRVFRMFLTFREGMLFAQIFWYVLVIILLIISLYSIKKPGKTRKAYHGSDYFQYHHLVSDDNRIE